MAIKPRKGDLINSKLQTPNSRETSNSKLQASRQFGKASIEIDWICRIADRRRRRFVAEGGSCWLRLRFPLIRQRDKNVFERWRHGPEIGVWDASHRQSLPPSARQQARALLQIRFNMGQSNQFVAAFDQGRAPESIKTPVKHQILIDRQFVIQRELLGHVTDEIFDLVSLCGDVEA